MQTSPPPQPVIRSYRGQSRGAAEEAYRLDAEQAASADWFPVAHRWVDQWDGHMLSVVFELRPPGAAAGDGSDRPPRADTSHPSAPAADAPAAAGSAMTDEVGAPAPRTAARAHARLTMQTIDLHCGGEPLRLIRSGFPQVPFASILERRRWVRDNADGVRRVAMHEPRGHRDMYGAILLPPHRADADVAVLWMHNQGYSTMCGHGIIAVTTALIEEQLYPVTLPQTVIRYEVPAGLVTARAEVRTGEWGGPEVEQVRFTNVPSYLAERDLALSPEGLESVGEAAAGTIRADLAFGGAYYGIVDAADLGLRVVPDQMERLRRAGATITELLRRDHKPTHPTEPELGFVYGTIIVDMQPATSPDGKAGTADLRNVTIFADAEVDRSPCGSGTSALLAQRHATGKLSIGQDLMNASITGEAFSGRVEGVVSLGSEDAVETSIAGSASVTGYQTFIVDDRDPLGGGFLLG